MYLRFIEPYGPKDFTFIPDEMSRDEDIKISDEDHRLFFKYQSECKIFSIKNREGASLFDILEVSDNEIKVIESPMEKLQKEQTKQDDYILTNLLANTELFEMVLDMVSQSMPATMSFMAMPAGENKTKGGNNMVEVYVALIIEGVKTIEEVPQIIRPQVVKRLGQLGITVLS